MRELDLQRAFLGLGAAAEDFQDQSCAVENLGVPGLLEIALLDRRKCAIHHHKFDVMSGDETCDLLDLALAGIGRRTDLADRPVPRIPYRYITAPPQPGPLPPPSSGIPTPLL